MRGRMNGSKKVSIIGPKDGDKLVQRQRGPARNEDSMGIDNPTVRQGLVWIE
jgi:hypothetical protein